MSSERKVTANRINGQKSNGPRTKTGKAKTSRNALQHGLAAIDHCQLTPSGEIARLAKAICGDDCDPALLAQAQVVARNEIVLRAIREQQVAVVERLRDPSAVALAEPDNRRQLVKARAAQADHAEKAIELLLPKVLEKYRDRLEPRDFDPTSYRYELVPLGVKVLLEEPDPEEEQRALDLARKQIEQEQRDEYEALEAAVPDLIRLERYERRAWSRQRRAIRELLKIKFTAQNAEAAPARGDEVCR